MREFNDVLGLEAGAMTVVAERCPEWEGLDAANIDDGSDMPIPRIRPPPMERCEASPSLYESQRCESGLPKEVLDKDTENWFPAERDARESFTHNANGGRASVDQVEIAPPQRESFMRERSALSFSSVHLHPTSSPGSHKYAPSAVAVTGAPAQSESLSIMATPASSLTEELREGATRYDRTFDHQAVGCVTLSASSACTDTAVDMGSGTIGRDKDTAGPPEKTRLFACPYFKHDPRRYSERNRDEIRYRRCSTVVLATIPRLKQHLYRVHRMPDHYCPRCFREFDDAKCLSQHRYQQPSCQATALRFDEKATYDQLKRIKRRAISGNPEGAWYAIWDILFPSSESHGVVRPSSPCTFIGCWVSHRGVAAFVNRSHRRGARFVDSG
ncbi:hypothetical protein PV04_06427 [Phialophora macrospora]|uniref:C2H2-type domain-containing protein n=1 Tax=Phialophora macrospora TaxID=1851006 RepID=A0A0D2FK66_9EURO|nr:hypothetical protein PV04_06427 [Phialophora macrospora]